MKLARQLAVLLLMAGMPGLVWAQGPGSGIAGTEHDFTGEVLSDPNDPNSPTTIGLCTFCHTPHKALASRLLWNHTLSSATYSWSDVTTTQGGTDLPTFDASWGGVSKNCLSCHDGSVAIGDVAWFGAQSRTGAAALLDHTHDDPNDPGNIATPTGDMAGNHPVAHPFPFNGTASTYNNVTTGSDALNSGWKADPTSLGIRLFVQEGTNVRAGTTAGATGIECSSCHDPHNGTGVVDDYFLRGALTGNDTDYICLKCHTK